MNMVHTENYDLGACYSRQLCDKGGVAIFVHDSVMICSAQILRRKPESLTLPRPPGFR